MSRLPVRSGSNADANAAAPDGDNLAGLDRWLQAPGHEANLADNHQDVGDAGPEPGPHIPRHLRARWTGCRGLQHEGDCWEICAVCGYRHIPGPCPAWVAAAVARARGAGRGGRGVAGRGGRGGHVPGSRDVGFVSGLVFRAQHITNNYYMAAPATRVAARAPGAPPGPRRRNRRRGRNQGRLRNNPPANDGGRQGDNAQQGDQAPAQGNPDAAMANDGNA
ncbi:MAG: hypothetical protein Q9216_002270 [Gyalolechia sp. 2 TL-2023]